jgi:hypothetical protein
MTTTEKEEPVPLATRTRHSFRFNTNVQAARYVGYWITEQVSHSGMTRVAMRRYRFSS